MPNFFSQLIRFTVKVVLAFLGVIFAISLLLAAVVLFSVSLLKWLFTGKKPAPFVIFGQFNRFRSGGGWAKTAQTKQTADVVDVEVREVKSDSDKTSQLKKHSQSL